MQWQRHRMGLPVRARSHLYRKTFLIMKILPILLMAASMPVCATGWGQNVSLRVEQAHPREVIKHLEKQTGYRFIYGSHLMEGTKPITIQANNQPLEKVLQQCFKEQPFDFEI